MWRAAKGAGEEKGDRGRKRGREGGKKKTGQEKKKKKKSTVVVEAADRQTERRTARP